MRSLIYTYVDDWKSRAYSLGFTPYIGARTIKAPRFVVRRWPDGQRSIIKNGRSCRMFIVRRGPPDVYRRVHALPSGVDLMVSR